MKVLRFALEVIAGAVGFAVLIGLLWVVLFLLAP